MEQKIAVRFADANFKVREGKGICYPPSLSAQDAYDQWREVLNQKFSLFVRVSYGPLAPDKMFIRLHRDDQGKQFVLNGNIGWREIQETEELTPNADCFAVTVEEAKRMADYILAWIGTADEQE